MRRIRNIIGISALTVILAFGINQPAGASTAGGTTVPAGAAQTTGTTGSEGTAQTTGATSGESGAGVATGAENGAGVATGTTAAESTAAAATGTAASTATAQEWTAADFVFEAASGTVRGFADKTAAAEKLNALSGILTIPGTLDNAAVKVIAAEAFKEAGNIQSVVLPEGLTEIAEKAFFKAGLAGELRLPDSIITVGRESFSGNAITGINFPTALKYLWPGAFANNQIAAVDMSALKNIYGIRWSIDLNIEAGRGIISYDLFENNKIQSLKLPGTDSGVWAVGSSAFAGNDIRNLSLPANIKNIYYSGFYKNPNMGTLTFETVTDHRGYKVGIVQIDRSSFEDCGIEGELVFPDEVNEIGGFTFARNKITKLVLPKYSIGLGYNAFDGNPVETVENLRAKSWLFEDSVFANTRVLKNVDFSVYDRARNNISYSTFVNGLLKTLEIPDSITSIDRTVFGNNPGWRSTSGFGRVGLYRLTADGQYNIDNMVKDGEAFVINPVDVRLQITDDKGRSVPAELLAELKLKVSRAGTADAIEVKYNQISDFDFKIGDSISISPIEIAEYEYQSAASVAGAKELTDGALSLKLTGTELTDESYGNGYKVGYKSATLKLTYKSLKPEPIPTPVPTPVPSNPVIIDPIPVVIINTDVIPPVNNPVYSIVNEDNVPLGNAVINTEDGTYAFVDDDSTPLGTAVLGDDGTLEILDEGVALSASELLNLPKTGDLFSYGFIIVMIAAVAGLVTVGRKKR